jgi:hypothetical protein
MYQIPLYFISLHVPHPFVFYLSACFTSLYVSYLCIFHIPSYFISLNVSYPFMFHVPPHFISLHFSSSYTLQATGAFHVGLYSRGSRFDALLEICMNITVILDVTPSTSVDKYQRFERTQYLTPTLKMVAARFSETFALIYQHRFSGFHGWYWSKDSLLGFDTL